MTVTQWKSAVRAADKRGSALLPDGSMLVKHGYGSWALYDCNRQCVESTWNPDILKDYCVD